MIINDEIEHLHHLVSEVKSGDIFDMDIFNRLFAVAVLSVLNKINIKLEELKAELDSSVKAEAVSIRFDVFLAENYWTKGWLFMDYEKILSLFSIDPSRSNTTEVNMMTDYLPNEMEGYKVTPNVLESFKTAIHQLSNEEKLNLRTLSYSLNMGLNKMLELLASIRKKVRSPQSHLYAKFWEEICDSYNDERIREEHREWKENSMGPNFEELKARQKQIVFALLNNDFFRFMSMPTGAAVKNRKLIINEDDLEYGTEIPSNMAVECAKFEKYIEWEGEHIITVNYEKLGKYIYKHYGKFSEDEIARVTRFDSMLEIIHEEMAKLKPQLKQYLKRYKENIVEELKNDCVEILNLCKRHLRKGVREGVLHDYVSKLLYDTEIKQEARSKLKGQSKSTYICEMIAYMKWYNVFGPVSIQDLATSLKSAFGSLKESTIKKYIENAYNGHEGVLFEWTRQNIEKLIAEPYNPYEKLFSGTI